MSLHVPQYPSWPHVHSHTLLDPRPLLQSLPAFTLARCAFLASAFAVISPEILPLPSWPVPHPAPDDTYFCRTTCIRVICDIGRITPADLKSLCITLVLTDCPLPIHCLVHCLSTAPPRRGHISAVPSFEHSWIFFNFAAYLFPPSSLPTLSNLTL